MIRKINWAKVVRRAFWPFVANLFYLSLIAYYLNTKGVSFYSPEYYIVLLVNAVLLSVISEAQKGFLNGIRK